MAHGRTVAVGHLPAVWPFSTALWYCRHASSFSLTKATKSCPDTSMAKREMKAVSGRITVRKISRAPASGLCTSLVTSVVAYLGADGKGRDKEMGSSNYTQKVSF